MLRSERHRRRPGYRSSRSPVRHRRRSSTSTCIPGRADTRTSTFGTSLVADDVEPRPPAGESPDVRWFPWVDAIAKSDAGLAGILRALAPADAGTVVVRRAGAADAAAVAALYLRSRRYAMPTIVSPHTDDEVRDWIAAHLVPEQETWVAEVAGVVVGVLALSAAARHGRGLVVDQLSIDQLYVDPPWIGRGLGRILVEHAKQRSADGLELWTFQVNAAARRFYARQGFVEVDWTDGAGNEEHEPDVRCRWGSERDLCQDGTCVRTGLGRLRPS